MTDFKYEMCIGLSNFELSTSKLMLEIISEIYFNNLTLSKGRIVAKANSVFSNIFPNTVDWHIEYNDVEFKLKLWFIIDGETVLIHSGTYGWDL